ncbi:MAG: ABC transporter permease [Armatimonadota bacterium]|nr:MAG: ABC transporter permease [Armatimonadota bacterium]
MWFRFITQRLLQLIPVLIGVSFIVFLTMHLTPGDPIEHMLGQAGRITQDQIEDLRAHYGLDRSFIVQYGLFLGHAAIGDFGRSYSYQGRPVRAVVAERLPATVELTVFAFVIAILFAIPAGVIASLRPHGPFDRTATVAALLGISMPGFWLGIVLMMIFGLRLHWLPISGRIDLGLAPAPITGLNVLDALLATNGPALWSAVKHLVLPGLAMAAPMAAMVTRMVRSSMIGVLEQDYVQFARAKGLPETTVVGKHALRNALIPTVNIVALQTGLLLSGNMIIETVFQYPGLGKLAVDAIAAADYPLVQAVVLIYAVSYVVLNLGADVLHALLDPRVRVA